MRSEPQILSRVRKFRDLRSSMRGSLIGNKAPARQLACGMLAILIFWFSHLALAANEQALEQLRLADNVKMTSHAQFVAILDSVQSRRDQLNTADRHYLSYLQSWRKVYDGRYQVAIEELNDLLAKIVDPVLELRARATLVNVYSLAVRYSDAFSELTRMLESLQGISDRDAREQALGVAALLYNQVEQYALGLEYAEMLIKEDWQGRGLCKGGQVKLEALYQSGQLSNADVSADPVVRACLAMGDFVRANLVRTYIARAYIDEGEWQRALALLNSHYEEALATRYSFLISEIDSIRAYIARNLGNREDAKKFALSSVTNGVQDQYTEPLVTAYRVLYETALDEGDVVSALRYHEKYAEVDKGYLDDISARQIAYEKVKHEILARQLQIDALNKQNEILQLERENNRLYIALLISVLAFIGLWAYKTKRLQMHFMRLSQKDGLTGIANRPYFLERAEQLIESSRKASHEVSIVLCDLDYFKAINDRFGHAAGDYVLKRTVEACQNHMRPEDLFGRFGGEEFGIVLAGCELAVARERCEQLRAAVESITAAEFGMHSNVTASFGVASARASGYDLRLLLAHADSALYQAKRQGRNCVVVYDRNSGAMPFAESGSARVDVA